MHLEIIERVKEFAEENVVNLIFTALLALAFIFIGFKLVNLFVKMLGKSRNFQKLEDSAESFLLSLVSVALKIIVIYIVITIVGINATALSTVFGSVGLAIGLALQGSLSNFAGGIMILFFRPFVIGDYIESGVNIGTVTEIGIFYTKILTLDNKTRIIPNSALSNTPVTNYSIQKLRTVDIDIPVVAAASVDTVKEIMLNAVKSNELVLVDPEPYVAVKAVAPALTTFTIQAWVKSENHKQVFHELNEAIKKALAENGF